jgi:uncharacterized protein (DUF1697 family)
MVTEKISGSSTFGLDRRTGLTTYVALLRGINLGGVNKISMKELRALVEGLGHEDVRTYLQSGNVVFESRSSTAKKLAAEIEDAVAKAFDLSVSVVMRTHPELVRVAAGNPFPTQEVKPTSLQVVFLAERASSKAVKQLDRDRSPPDQFDVKGREIYLWLPNGSARSKLNIDYFETKLGTTATARNWNTVLRVRELMERS